KNYKLKYSRLLTCYSALLYLLGVFNKAKTVRPEDVQAMARLTPTKRLEWILRQTEFTASHDKVQDVIARYEQFLTNTNAEEPELIERFADKDQRKRYVSDAYAFGDAMLEIIDSIGQKTRLHRMLVV